MELSVVGTAAMIVTAPVRAPTGAPTITRRDITRRRIITGHAEPARHAVPAAACDRASATSIVRPGVREILVMTVISITNK